MIPVDGRKERTVTGTLPMPAGSTIPVCGSSPFSDGEPACRRVASQGVSCGQTLWKTKAMNWWQDDGSPVFRYGHSRTAVRACQDYSPGLFGRLSELQWNRKEVCLSQIGETPACTDGFTFFCRRVAWPGRAMTCAASDICGLRFSPVPFPPVSHSDGQFGEAC